MINEVDYFKEKLKDTHIEYLVNCDIDCHRKFYPLISATISYLKECKISTEFISIYENNDGIVFNTYGDNDDIMIGEILDCIEYLSQKIY
jgi:hypothetical protein